MLKLVVVDSSAESRNRIVNQITALTRSDIPDIALLPQFSIKGLSPDELKFHGAPDIAIVGDDLVAEDLTNVGQIRRALPNTPILVRVTATHARLAVVEQIARMGADDVWPHDAAPAEFLRKLVLLSRKVQKAKSGKLIVVDGGKGGVGVTSVAAGVAEALFAAGKRVLLVDLDSQTQDLSRFLQTKPFVNENLQLLLEQGRPVTQESVEQATAPIWQGESGFSCMTPVSEQEGLLDPRSSFPRVFMNVLEVVDSLYDCVVVDLASAQGALLRTLYRVADRVVFVVNGDPAALYSSVDRLSRIRGAIAPDTQILVVENGTARAGLSHALLHQEFCRAARLSPEEWLEGGLPYCRQGARWPASGGTLTSLASAGLRSAMNRLLVSLQLIEGGASDRSSRAIDYVQTLFANLRGSLGSKKAGAPLPAGAPQLALPTKAGVSTIGDQPLATPAVSARGTLLTTGRPPSEEVRIAPSVRAPLLKLNPPRRGESSTESQPLDGRKLVSGAKFS